MRITPENITELKPNEVFVFGSNMKGIHGKGAAKAALEWGAVFGVGFGERGQTFAIPTKISPYETLPIEDIAVFVKRFRERLNPEKHFLVTAIGCGYAGYTAEDIAPLFLWAVGYENISLPESFWNVLKRK